jgi:hypothetical protein
VKLVLSLSKDPWRKPAETENRYGLNEFQNTL